MDIDSLLLEISSAQTSADISKIYRTQDETKKHITRLEYDKADNSISIAINSLLDLIKKVDPNMASKEASLEPDCQKKGFVDSKLCQQEVNLENRIQTSSYLDEPKSLNKVLSVLLNVFSKTQDDHKTLISILRGIERHYPDISVYIASKDPLPENLSLNLNMTIVSGITGNLAATWKSAVRCGAVQ